MLHPMEFTTRNSNGVLQTSINTTMITELRSLLTMVKNSGLKCVPVGRIALERANETLSEGETMGTTGSVTGGNSSTTGAPRFDCNCVAFRLDGVQDYYQAGAQKAIMGVFEELKVSLTIGKKILRKVGKKYKYIIYIIKN